MELDPSIFEYTSLVLGLAAGFLGIFGKTFNEEKRQLTKRGWATLTVAILTLLAGIAKNHATVYKNEKDKVLAKAESEKDKAALRADSQAQKNELENIINALHSDISKSYEANEKKESIIMSEFEELKTALKNLSLDRRQHVSYAEGLESTILSIPNAFDLMTGIKRLSGEKPPLSDSAPNHSEDPETRPARVQTVLIPFDKSDRLYRLSDLSPQDKDNIKTFMGVNSSNILGVLKGSGSFREGIVLTKSGLQFSDPQRGKTFLSYEDFSKNDLEFKFISINYNNKTILNTGYTIPFKKILEAVRKVLQVPQKSTHP